jgi:hypothetical protein
LPAPPNSASSARFVADVELFCSSTGTDTSSLRKKGLATSGVIHY